MKKCILVLILSLVTIVGFSVASLRGFYLDEVEMDLQARAAFVQGQIGQYIAEGNAEALQALCNTLGEKTDTRITVVMWDGKVVGDSEEDPSSMENHANRPEILQARDSGIGQSIRLSTTLNQKMMYVAVPVEGESASAAILRVALPITSIEDTMWGLIRRLGYGAAVVALLSAIASWLVAKRITRPLGALRDGAEKFSRGELDHKLITHHSQEIDALTDAMNTMATELNERISLVTQQKREQEAILSSMVEGVLAVDETGSLISMNKTAADLFGVDVRGALGRNVSELIRNTTFHEFLAKTLHSSEPIEEEIIFHENTKQIYDAHGTALHGEGEGSTGAVIVLHDVTHVRNLERVRRDFVSNVSHELRTPITSVKGFIETLIDNPPNDESEFKRFLGIIDKNVTQLNTLINDLLSLSRIEQGELGVGEMAQRASLYSLLNEACRVCQPAANEKNVAFSIQCNDEEDVFVHPSLLKQAVVNLIDNAIKFSEAGQQIFVEAYSDVDCHTICVTDHGVGIAPEHLPRLFERFYRVDKARSRELGGTGLGLAIVKHITELHGGTVRVESEVGERTSFYIELPVSKARS